MKTFDHRLNDSWWALRVALGTVCEESALAAKERGPRINSQLANTM